MILYQKRMLSGNNQNNAYCWPTNELYTPIGRVIRLPRPRKMCLHLPSLVGRLCLSSLDPSRKSSLTQLVEGFMQHFVFRNSCNMQAGMI